MKRITKYSIAIATTALGFLGLPFLALAQITYQSPTYVYTSGYYPINLTNNAYSYQLPSPIATNNIIYSGVGGYYYQNSVPSLVSHTSVNPNIYNWAIGPTRWSTSYPTYFATNQNNVYGVTGSCTCPSGYLCAVNCVREYSLPYAGFGPAPVNQVFFYSY